MRNISIARTFIAGVLLLSPPAIMQAATADPPAPEALDLWQDDSFQKSFVGSYGFNAEIEPRVTTVEREQLQEKLYPLLSGPADVAIETIEKLMTPDSSAVFDFTLGNLHYQEGRLDDAAAHYETAIAKFPSFRRAHKNLGLIYVRNGRFEEALGSLSRVIQLGGNEGLVYGLLGYAYSQTEKYVSAESAYRNAVLLEPGTLDWKLGLTHSVIRQNKHNEAIGLLDELIGQYPDRADFWMLQANAYIGLGQPMKAAGNFEIVHRMGKATFAGLQTLGDIYTNEGLWDLAERAYGQALDLDTDRSIDRPLRFVEALSQRGATENAGRLMARVKSSYGDTLDDADRKKLLKLEARMAVAEGTGGEALTVLQEIVALDPLDGEALLLLGQHHARIDEPDQAIFYYERAENLDGFEAEAKIRHGQLLVSMARYTEAVPLLKRAQEMRPSEELERYLDQVERLARSKR